jgi:hypothetical protein
VLKLFYFKTGGQMRKYLALFAWMILAVSQGVCEENLFYSSSTPKERTQLLEEYKKAKGERLDSVKGLLFEKAFFERILYSDSLLGEPPTEDDPENLLVDKKAIPILVYALGNDPSWEVRENIAKKMGKYPKEQIIIKALNASLKDVNEKVKIASSKSLLSITKDNQDAIDNILYVFYLSRNIETKILAMSSLPDSYAYKKQYFIHLLITTRTDVVLTTKILQNLIEYSKNDKFLTNVCLIKCLEVAKTIFADPVRNPSGGIDKDFANKMKYYEINIDILKEMIYANLGQVKNSPYFIKELEDAIVLKQSSYKKSGNIFINDLKDILTKVK